MDGNADPRIAVLLRAVDLATESDIKGLTGLIPAHQDLLQLEVVLRILLTYLPESTDPSLYVGFLQALEAGNLDSAERTEDDHAAPGSEPEQQHLNSLPLLVLPSLSEYGLQETELLTRFLIAKAHKIDAETGSLHHVKRLVEPFVNRSEYLRVWTTSILLPLLRSEYELYPDSPQKFTLKAFEALQGRTGLYTLLFELLRRNKAPARHEYARDFRQILGPWMVGETWRAVHSSKSDGEQNTRKEEVIADIWGYVYEALLDHAIEYPSSIVELAQSWNGPDDVDCGPLMDAEALHGNDQAKLGYCQMLLAAIYLPLDVGSGFTREQQGLLLRKVAALIQVDLKHDPLKPDLVAGAEKVPHEVLESISSIHLARGELMEDENPLTYPSEASLHLAALLTASTTVLESLGESMPLQGVANLAFFGESLDQKKRVQKILRALSSRSSAGDGFWREMRQKVIWLHQWNTQGIKDSPKHGVFCRVEVEEMEIEILKTLIAAGRFKLLSHIYVSTDSHLSQQIVEKTLIDAALASYDGSENGNKTRGEMKQASDVISTFRHQFPQSDRFRELHHLIQATHALSYYTIKLDNGLPCLPGRLRSLRNPLVVIERLLAQNPKSYTKLDDLIDIGRNLARAGLVQSTNGEADRALQNSNAVSDQLARQIIAKAVEAALAEGDFDTAYSYVVNRLSLSRSDARSQSSYAEGEDDPLWEAAYHAGRYRSAAASGPSELRRIEQRMELLAQAIQLAPPSSLLEILQTWRECEEELNESLSKDTDEEEDWSGQGDRTIPGGFSMGDVVPVSQKPREYTRGALSEEAPMGLFDVARGAAAAFSKSAFPLAGQASRAAAESEQSAEGAGRVRKRDMVSSAVTGGLASGIGWVIGARPANDE